MPTAYLISGPTGAGKTTYATRLADEKSALRYSIDEWMRTLFWMEAPEPLTYAWALERVERCEAMILQVGIPALQRDVDIILDLGFFSQIQRIRVQEAIVAAGYEAQMVFLRVPREERWKRVGQRNTEKGPTYQLEVTRGMFDFGEGLFEEPTPAELEGAEILE